MSALRFIINSWTHIDGSTGRSLYCSSVIGTSDGMSISILSLWWFMCQCHIKSSTAFIYKQWCLTCHNKKTKQSLTKMPILQIQDGCMTAQKYQVRVFTVGKQILLKCWTLTPYACKKRDCTGKINDYLSLMTTQGHEVLFSQGNACILQPAPLKAWSSRHQSAFFIDLIEHKN